MPLLLLLGVPASLWASKKALDEITNDMAKVVIVGGCLYLAWRYRGALFKV